MSEESNFYVYLHRRASDGKVFYVGKGRNKRAWSKSERNDRWNKTYRKHGLIVDIAFESLSEDEAFELEVQTILEMRHCYEDTICNITNGGEGASGYKHTDEAKERFSERMKRAYCPEMAKKLAEGVRKYYSTQNYNRTKSYSGKPWLHPNAPKKIYTNLDVLFEYYKRGLLTRKVFPEYYVYGVVKLFDSGYTLCQDWYKYQQDNGRVKLAEFPEMALHKYHRLCDILPKVIEYVDQGHGYVNIANFLGVKKSNLHRVVSKIKSDADFKNNVTFIHERIRCLNH